MPLLAVCQVVSRMATGVGSAAGSFGGEKQHSMRFIVAASGAGTIIEWYDFYIFGSLATLMAVKFFHAADTGAFLLTLGTFAAGFAVRPFGAVVFGRIGDLVGRKYAFLLTTVLVAASLFIRWQLRETPLFSKLKREGRTSKHPTREALGNWANWKLILLALFGATAGQAVVWYTGQFYSLYFMQVSLKMDKVLAAEIVLVALALATPFFIVFV